MHLSVYRTVAFTAGTYSVLHCATCSIHWEDLCQNGFSNCVLRDYHKYHVRVVVQNKQVMTETEAPLRVRISHFQFPFWNDWTEKSSQIQNRNTETLCNCFPPQQVPVSNQRTYTHTHTVQDNTACRLQHTLQRDTYWNLSLTCSLSGLQYSLSSCSWESSAMLCHVWLLLLRICQWKGSTVWWWAQSFP